MIVLRPCPWVYWRRLLVALLALALPPMLATLIVVLVILSVLFDGSAHKWEYDNLVLKQYYHGTMMEALFITSCSSVVAIPVSIAGITLYCDIVLVGPQGGTHKIHGVWATQANSLVALFNDDRAKERQQNTNCQQN